MHQEDEENCTEQAEQREYATYYHCTPLGDDWRTLLATVFAMTQQASRMFYLELSAS